MILLINISLKTFSIKVRMLLIKKKIIFENVCASINTGKKIKGIVRNWF